jgi:hypothetical protein
MCAVTRPVYILATDRRVGERLRLEQLDQWVIGLSCETVHPEQIENPQAQHYQTLELIELSQDHLRWLHQATGELLSTLELAEADHVEGIPEPASVDAKFDKGGE